VTQHDPAIDPSASGAPEATTTRRVSAAIHHGVAWLLVFGVFVQIFLAGLGVFAGGQNFATHRDFGYTLTFLPVVLLVTALLARLGRRHAVVPAVVVGLFILQSLLVAMRDDASGIAALHPVNGVVILLAALWIARDRWAASRAPTAPPAVAVGSSAAAE
jgi:hypothetical protein